MVRKPQLWISLRIPVEGLGGIRKGPSRGSQAAVGPSVTEHIFDQRFFSQAPGTFIGRAHTFLIPQLCFPSWGIFLPPSRGARRLSGAVFMLGP